MSTSIYPPVAVADLAQKRHDILDRELSWLMSSFKETLEYLQEGVEECLGLLSPDDKPSTLAVSQGIGQELKGFLTRSGTSLVRGQLTINLSTFPIPFSEHSISTPYPLPALTTIYSLLADSRLLLNTILGTEPLTAPFLSDQLLLLSEQIFGVSALLAGKSPEHRLVEQSTAQLRNLASAPLPPFAASDLPPLFIRKTIGGAPDGSSKSSSGGGKNTVANSDAFLNLSPEVLPPVIFTPSLTPQIVLTFTLKDDQFGAGFVITARTLAAADAPTTSLRERLGLGPQIKEHGEMNFGVTYGDRRCRIREKATVMVADPGLVSLSLKANAMARVVKDARNKMEHVLEAKRMIK